MGWTIPTTSSFHPTSEIPDFNVSLLFYFFFIHFDKYKYSIVILIITVKYHNIINLFDKKQKNKNKIKQNKKKGKEVKLVNVECLIGK